MTPTKEAAPLRMRRASGGEAAPSVEHQEGPDSTRSGHGPPGIDAAGTAEVATTVMDEAKNVAEGISERGVKEPEPKGSS
jgi:hypothetical protein